MAERRMSLRIVVQACALLLCALVVERRGLAQDIALPARPPFSGSPTKIFKREGDVSSVASHAMSSGTVLDVVKLQSAAQNAFALRARTAGKTYLVRDFALDANGCSVIACNSKAGTIVRKKCGAYESFHEVVLDNDGTPFVHRHWTRERRDESQPVPDWLPQGKWLEDESFDDKESRKPIEVLGPSPTSAKVQTYEWLSGSAASGSRPLSEAPQQNVFVPIRDGRTGATTSAVVATPSGGVRVLPLDAAKGMLQLQIGVGPLAVSAKGTYGGSGVPCDGCDALALESPDGLIVRTANGKRMTWVVVAWNPRTKSVQIVKAWSVSWKDSLVAVPPKWTRSSLWPELDEGILTEEARAERRSGTKTASGAKITR